MTEVKTFPSLAAGFTAAVGPSISRAGAAGSWLVGVWSLYFCAVYTVGRFPEWTRATIWLGGLIAGLLTVTRVRRFEKRIPTETWLVVGFFIWSLVGLFNVSDYGNFVYYLRLTLQTAGMIALFGLAIRHSGRVTGFWWATVVVGLFNAIAVVPRLETSVVEAITSQHRQAGLTDNPNGLSFMCFVGILGCLALLGESKALWEKGLVLVALPVLFWGMIVAGSRGAFLSFFLAVFLWPWMCLRVGTRRKAAALLIGLVTAAALYPLMDWVKEETNLGRRIEALQSEREQGEGSRYELVVQGLKIAAENPVLGVGLGQFGVAVGTRQYAHNEVVELLATTGLPGFLLFASVYWLAWRRLSAALRLQKELLVRYRINFMRMLLIILVVAGAIFRPNFISVDTMFLLALVVGYSHWANDQIRRVSSNNLTTVRILPRPRADSRRLDERPLLPHRTYGTRGVR